MLTRARPEEFNSATNSGNPSPKKQARVLISPDSFSRKRTRLEDQLSDIQYIDCNTPDNVTVSTTAVIHQPVDLRSNFKGEESDSYQPKNKSPRNSSFLPQPHRPAVSASPDPKRQSLNLESNLPAVTAMPKSRTEADLQAKNTPTPQSPNYRELVDSSPESTPDLEAQTEVECEKVGKKAGQSPKYENVLTTISITYKSPSKTLPKAATQRNEDGQGKCYCYVQSVSKLYVSLLDAFPHVKQPKACK